MPNYAEHWRVMQTALGMVKPIDKAIDNVSDALAHAEDCTPDEQGFTPCGITEDKTKETFAELYDELSLVRDKLHYIKSLMVVNNLTL